MPSCGWLLCIPIINIALLSSSLLPIWNFIHCTTLSVPFQFPVPFVFFFPPSSYSVIGRIIIGIIIPTNLVYCGCSSPQTNNRDHPTRPFYRSVTLSCRTVSFCLSLRVIFVLVLVLVCLSTPTGPTPSPLFLMMVESILNWIRTHLSRRPTVYRSMPCLSVTNSPLDQ